MSYPKQHPSYKQRDEKQQRLSSKKEQLKNLLINKFRGKYCIPAEVSDQDRIIKQEVETFLAGGQVTENDLIKLDKKLQKVLSAQGIERKSSSSNALKANTQGPHTKSKLENLLDQNNNYQTLQQQPVKPLQTSNLAYQDRKTSDAISQAEKTNRSKSNAMARAGAAIVQISEGDDKWTKIIKHNVEEFHKEQEEAKYKAKLSQLKMKQDLEDQVRQQKKLRESEKQKEIEYVLQQKRIAEQQEKSEKEKQENAKKKYHEEQLRQEQHLKDLNQKRKDEVEREKRMEDERRRKIEREAEEQKRREREKAEQYKRQCQNQLEENRRLKEVQRQKELSEANKVPLGQDLLGQLFQKKQHISYEKRAQIDQQVEMLKDKIFDGEQRKAKQIQLEKEDIQKQKLQQKIKEEETKQNLIRQKEKETKQYLERQIQEKQAKNKLIKQQDHNEALNINQDVQKYKEEEKMKKERSKKQRIDQRHQLEEQMGSAKKRKIAMDQKEYQLNKQLLDEIEGTSHTDSPNPKIKKPF